MGLSVDDGFKRKSGLVFELSCGLARGLMRDAARRSRAV